MMHEFLFQWIYFSYQTNNKWSKRLKLLKDWSVKQRRNITEGRDENCPLLPLYVDANAICFTLKMIFKNEKSSVW